MIQVQGPDGIIYEFPEGTDEATMAAALQKVYGAPQQASQQEDPPIEMDPETGMPVGMVLNPRTGQVEDVRSPINPNIPQGAGNAAALGVGQGTGFGMLDEAVAGLGALTGSSYEYDLARMREADRRAKADHPMAYYGGMIPGAVGSSSAIWSGVPKVGSLLSRALIGAGQGAAEGAAFGFGSGEGAEDRLSDATKGGAIGAGFGFAAPYVTAGATAVGRSIGDMVGGVVDTALNRGSKGRAARALAETVAKSGKTPDDIASAVAAAAREGQPEYRMVDAMGNAGARRMSGLVRSGGEGSSSVAEALAQRQTDQADRVASFIGDAFGFRGQPTSAASDVSGVISAPARSAKDATSRMVSARGDAAYKAYNSASDVAGPVDLRGALGVIDDRIGGMQGSGVDDDGISGALKTFRKRMIAEPGGDAFPGASSVTLSDYDRVLILKQDVQDAIGDAMLRKHTNKARELIKLEKALDSALEESSAGYRAANDRFHEASRVIGAVETGAEMSRQANRATDTIADFSSMTPEQQAAARIGYGDKLLGKIEGSTASTANKAKAFSSTKGRSEADAMAINPELFRRRMDRENAMWATQDRALGGSRTADNQMDIRDVGAMAGVGRAIKNAISGNIGTAAGDVASVLAPMAKGENEATRRIILDALMSSDPQSALAPAIRQEAMSEARRKIIEALVRSGGRAGAGD